MMNSEQRWLMIKTLLHPAMTMLFESQTYESVHGCSSCNLSYNVGRDVLTKLGEMLEQNSGEICKSKKVPTIFS